MRQTESLVQQARGGDPPRGEVEPRSKDPNVVDAERRLHALLGSRVSIVRNGKGAGKIEIRFRSDEELERLFEILVNDQPVVSGSL